MSTAEPIRAYIRHDHYYKRDKGQSKCACAMHDRSTKRMTSLECHRSRTSLVQTVSSTSLEPGLAIQTACSATNLLRTLVMSQSNKTSFVSIQNVECQSCRLMLCCSTLLYHYIMLEVSHTTSTKTKSMHVILRLIV